jgi:hypothetical protein
MSANGAQSKLYCHCPTENFLPIIQVAKGDFAPALKCRRTLHPSRDAR